MKHIAILCVSLLMACNTTKNTTTGNNPITNSDKPKNIILLIGDGMGLTQVTAGIYSNSNYMNFERFPVVGLHKNYSSDNLVTDSAAGATAFSCGVKSYNGAIGVDSDTIPVKTILEEVEERGMMTGLVATSSIVHATPASFAAHNKYRKNFEEIAADMSVAGVDVMIGGGKSYFDRRESDDRNLYDEMKSQGYQISDYFSKDFSEINVAEMGKKWAYFTADKEPLSYEAGRDYLVPASKVAIDFLDTNAGENGFFIMIEGSQIDWAGHANNFDFFKNEILEYDKVIGDALDFAEKDGNTLVIVTADHETGGLAIQPGSKMDNINAAYTSDYHTATMIPVFAYGPGAELFGGIYENTKIYNKMRRALGLE